MTIRFIKSKCELYKLYLIFLAVNNSKRKLKFNNFTYEYPIDIIKSMKNTMDFESNHSRRRQI